MVALARSMTTSYGSPSATSLGARPSTSCHGLTGESPAQLAAVVGGPPPPIGEPSAPTMRPEPSMIGTASSTPSMSSIWSTNVGIEVAAGEVVAAADHGRVADDDVGAGVGLAEQVVEAGGHRAADGQRRGEERDAEQDGHRRSEEPPLVAPHALPGGAPHVRPRTPSCGRAPDRRWGRSSSRRCDRRRGTARGRRRRRRPDRG